MRFFRGILLTMLKPFLLLIATFVSLVMYGQNRADLVKQYSYPISSISINDSSDGDLQAIADAIGYSRIVMLGEMDNGDGETFKAKARLVKFLHQKLGFSVLAFESDFYGTNMLWDQYKNGDSVLRAVWDVWTEVEEFDDMKNYISKHSKGADPLIISGFDCQIYYEPGVRNFLLRAYPLLTALGYDDASGRNYLQTLVRANDYDTAKKLPDTTISFLRKYTLKLMDDLQKRPDLDSSGFMRQSFNSLMGNAANCWLNRKVPVGYNFFRIQLDGTIHDMQMASDLQWLIDHKFKDRKIIVWSHNLHVSKNPGLLEVDFSNFRKTQNSTMGDELAKKYKDELFTIGFTSYDGTSGSPYQRNLKYFEILPLAKQDWYTSSMASSKLKYAFTNFRALQKTPAANDEFMSRGWGYLYPMKGPWFQVFDGMFFIRTQKHSTATENVEWEN